MLENDKIWYIICLLVSIGRVFSLLGHLREIDHPLEISRNHVHDSLGVFSDESLELHQVLVEHESCIIQFFHAGCEVNFR